MKSAWQEEVENKILKKPYHKRRGLVYSVVDRGYMSIHGAGFIPTWDGTDHFHFVCEKCKAVADVIAVNFNPNYGGDVKYALFFYLGCPKCGETGQRKIYLDIRDCACIFQATYDEGKIFIYGEKREPENIIPLASSVNASNKAKDVLKSA